MRDRFYQWLKDATSFGLISDKSAEIRESKYSNIGQFSILAMPSCSIFVCKLADDDITSSHKA